MSREEAAVCASAYEWTIERSKQCNTSDAEIDVFLSLTDVFLPTQIKTSASQSNI